MQYVGLRGQYVLERSRRWVQFRSNKQTRNLHAMRSEVLRNFRLAGYPTRIRNDPHLRPVIRYERGMTISSFFLDTVAILFSSSSDGLKESIHVLPGASLSSATLRSEEHTSELQSRQYLVCRLL